MKTKTPTCCNKATFASEEEARRYWERIKNLGVSRVLPTDVEQCMRGWHLVFPPSEKEEKPRKPLKRTKPKKTARPKGVPAAVKRILVRRSGGVCEVGLSCGGASEAHDPAHREGKKAGGTRAEWSNSPATLLAACRRDHRLIDGVEVSAAERLGLKVRSGVARPWEIPVKHARFGWVLLDDKGGHRPAPAGSYAEGRRPTPVVACTERELIQQDGAFAEAMDRYGHLQCPGWSAPVEGLFTCGCGSSPFVVQVVAS
ncbi:hypothetical protein [Nonomuraea wenchangensis]|uniref:HNH endonuclease n=1 Tax=Nonomuraea wenchangensis TaxID=568860 RepID=A0A1I0F3H6_9ACTN|nr:hypothetical protein [Nonomuraea wenchangensis]SET52217.1 hypothetical protein SAMN05421811_103299 [Nonomuraea wenchangensis]